MPKHIIVIGASAGGIEALRILVGALPADLPASVFIVLHTSPESPALLAEILARSGRLPATNAKDGERILPGRIYVAPPDRHLLIEPNVMRVTSGPKENHFRPVVHEMFPGIGEIRKGYLYDSGKPGLGLDIDEELAAKYPFGQIRGGGAYKTDRTLDGTVIKP